MDNFLEFFCNLFGWQGGTLHQVAEKVCLFGGSIRNLPNGLQLLRQEHGFEIIGWNEETGLSYTVSTNPAIFKFIKKINDNYEKTHNIYEPEFFRPEVDTIL